MNTRTCGLCTETIDLDNEIWFSFNIEGTDIQPYFHKDCAIGLWIQMDNYLLANPRLKASVEEYRRQEAPKPRTKRAKKQNYELYNMRGKTIAIGDEMPTTDTIRKILAKIDKG